MTATRELLDAKASRSAARRRWRCVCGQVGHAMTARLAVAELWAHDQLAHVEPRTRLAAAEAMLRAVS